MRKENLREIKQNIVGALIISSDAKILMGQKPPHPQAVYQEYYHFPGGGIDDEDEVYKENGELDLYQSGINAAIREAKEEAGLELHPEQVIFMDDKGTGEGKRTLRSGETVLCKMTFYVYGFQLDQMASEIKIQEGDDLKNLRWFAKNELMTASQMPASIALFTRLEYIQSQQ